MPRDRQAAKRPAAQMPGAQATPRPNHAPLLPSRVAHRPTPRAAHWPYFSTTFCTMGSASSQVNLDPMTIETVLPDGASTNSDTAPASEV